MAGSFVRSIDLETVNKTIRIHQQEVGDVGCVVWDAAIVLSRYLEICSFNGKLSLTGRKVIELGSGLGCVGLTAACLGADVTMTDLPELLPLLQKNISANEDMWKDNGGKAIAKCLNWSTNFKINDWFQPDLLLIADCIYYLKSVDELIATMTKLCSETTEVIISQEERDSENQRNVWNAFLEKFKKIFDYYTVAEEEQHPVFRSPDILIIRARKRLKN